MSLSFLVILSSFLGNFFFRQVNNRKTSIITRRTGRIAKAIKPPDSNKVLTCGADLIYCLISYLGIAFSSKVSLIAVITKLTFTGNGV